MTERFKVVPAAYVLLRRCDAVLLQLRQNTGYMDGFWATGAAGHVEQGESVFEAAVREAREELTVRVPAADLRPLTTMHRTCPGEGAGGERVDFFFECRSWEGVPRRAETTKCAELRWFDLAALPDRLVPYERFVLGQLRDGTLPLVCSFGFT